MSKFTKYASIVCGALLLLWLIAVVGVQSKHYALDPLNFFERDSRFLCVHMAHDVVILAGVIAAAGGLFSDLQRMRKSKKISAVWFVICSVLLLWVAGYLLLFFTVGIAFLCGGG